MSLMNRTFPVFFDIDFASITESNVNNRACTPSQDK